jgi:glucose/arabinose dehydrogenase
MRRHPLFLASSTLILATFTACSTTPNPSVNPSADVPRDQSDAGPDVVDNGPIVDVANDLRDSAAPDVAPPDVGPDAFDVPAVDVPPGTTWCDMPMAPGAEVRGVTMPAGFCIRRYASFEVTAPITFGHPRVLAFAPNGELFVSSPKATGPGGTGPGIDAITILPDDNRDGRADGVLRFAEGAVLNQRLGMGQPETVHGLLFQPGFLYYTIQNGVYRVPFRTGDRRLAAGVTPELIADLANSERWTHTLAAAPDGTIYVSMGIYGSSTCPYPSPERGAVLAIGPGRSMVGGRITAGDIVARGFRNPMYIRCHPWGCFAAELTDDGWTVPGREKIVRLAMGQDYGYPCCYDRGAPSPANPGGGIYNCNNVTASPLGFPVGHTPFGHDFAPATWPAPYANGLFVGLHGVVGSWAFTGINWAPTMGAAHDLQGPAAMNFLTGWGRGTPNEGRVADLAFAPDGRLFFTDDQLGHVYWIAPTTLTRPAP